jgi:tRNA(Ile)-lysidine synthetase-like protein
MKFRALLARIVSPKGKIGSCSWQHLAVDDDEFRFRFQRTWQCYPKRIGLCKFIGRAHQKDADLRITKGIAVSGGIDSMALAWLTRSLAAAENMEVHAFIVDHGARPECAEEARSVAQIMKGYNFQPHILRLSWDSKTLRGGFETHARILRYRALARACVENRIRHVMLGHHSDDLAETVLMRLLLSSRTEGLAGMRQKVPMPETWGIYGADGIYIGRPLLNCSKVISSTGFLQS